MAPTFLNKTNNMSKDKKIYITGYMSPVMNHKQIFMILGKFELSDKTALLQFGSQSPSGRIKLGAIFNMEHATV